MAKQRSLLEEVQRAGKHRRPVREAAITKAILGWLNSLPGCRAVKRHGTAFGQRGEPDVTGCWRLIAVQAGCVFGQRFEIEVKVPGEEATPLQRERLSQWAAAGATTGVVHSLEEAKALFQAAHLI